jgi:hypothetical protein
MEFAMPVKIPGLVIAGSLLFSVTARCDTAVKCSFKTLAACPKIGCSKPNSPLAVTNSQKRTVSINGSPAEITFPDLQDLQDDVGKTFAGGPVVIKGAKVSSYHNMKAAPRKIILSGLKTGSGNFSEGDFVELFGFIAATTGDPHPNPGESVNCKLTTGSSSDYHINITPAKNEDETQGVVVEMIPQDPHRKSDTWSLVKLKAIEAHQLPVKIEGRLFFDSEHSPNLKKGATSGGPRRFSLWEIHPLLSFFVCPSGTCTKTAGWKALEDWSPSP